MLQLADVSISGMVDCDSANPSPDRKSGCTSKPEILVEACSLGGSVWVTLSVAVAGKATEDEEDIAFFWVDNMTGTSCRCKVVEWRGLLLLLALSMYCPLLS